MSIMEVRDNIIDFSKICRLCLMEESVMSSIYNETDKHSSTVPLPLRIMACVSIELNSIDGLPSQICTTCMCQVDGWYKFKDLCETADALLKKCVKNEPVQPEAISEIRSKAKEVRQLFTSSHLVKAEGLDSSLNSLKAVKPVKDVRKAEEEAEEGVEEAEEESPEREPGGGGLPHENGKGSEESLEEGAQECSSDEEVSLSVRKRKLGSEKSGSKGGRTKKKGGKGGAEVVRFLRSVQAQTDGDGEGDGEEEEEGGGLEVIEMKTEEGGWERKRMKSRKTQTPREQGSGKRRFRIRPAVPSSCTLCDKVYKNSEILRQHMKSHHVTGTIECPSCKLTFTSLRSLKYHEQRKHSNLEPVPCSFCGKKFLDKKYLRIHENIHSQTNHFVCQFCGRKFIMKTNLTVHISRHHTKKSNDFVCQICGKAFPFKLYLKKHFKTHTDYKPYQCTYCEAKFRENTLLRKHVNSIHLKLRPFLCQYCHKTFTRSLYLREHMESQHLGIQRKVECSRCGETFQNRNRLRQHECLARMDIVRME